MPEDSQRDSPHAQSHASVLGKKEQAPHLICAHDGEEVTGNRDTGKSQPRACSFCFGERAVIIHTKDSKGIYSQSCCMSRCLQQAGAASRICRGSCGEEAEELR